MDQNQVETINQEQPTSMQIAQENITKCSKLYSLFISLKQNEQMINYHKKKAFIHRRKAEQLTQQLFLLSSPTTNGSMWSLYRSSIFWEKEVPRNGDKKFKEDFRMSRSSFDWLANQMQHLKREDTSFRSSINLKKRIAVALYALASSSEYRTIANIFGIGRTTVGEIVLEFCQTVCDVFEDQYLNYYPPTQEKIDEIVKGFEKWGFPQTYGAVDGCHIEICPPKDAAIDYYNYKGWYSIILLAAVDYRYRLTYINIGSPGRNNDSFVFERSSLKMCHEHHPLFTENAKEISNTQVPVLLIGDSAFKFSKHLMKPFPITCTEEKQINYNTALSRARRVVENAFGHLKARFRKIGRGLQVKIENAPIIIKACCILHNILNERNDEINEMWLEEVQRDNTSREQPHFETSTGNLDGTANDIRNSLMEYFSSSSILNDG